MDAVDILLTLSLQQAGMGKFLPTGWILYAGLVPGRPDLVYLCL